MVKLMLTFRYSKEIPRNVAEAHYLSFHTTKTIESMQSAPGVLRYVQNRVVRHEEFWHNIAPGKETPPAFDRSVEFFFADREAMTAYLELPALKELWEDHPNFMDTSSLTQELYELEETVPALRGPDGSLYERISAEQRADATDVPPVESRLRA